MLRLRAPSARAVAFAVAAAVAAMGATLLTASTPLLQQNAFLLHLVVVLLAGLAGGLGPGLVATVVAVLGAGYAMLEPVGSFAVAAEPDRVRVGLLLVLGILTSVLHALRAARRGMAERERALRASEESYRSLFDNSADAVYIVNAAGRVVEANAAAAAMFGHPAETMLGLSPWMLSDTTRVDVDQERERVRRVLDGESQRFEWWGRRADGEPFPVEIALSPTRYFGQPAVLATARDLTERRRLEEQLNQAQKMEAVGQLAGGVSHDFNNLLTTIRGHTSLLSAALPPEDALQGDLAEIERAADLATHVTRQLLAFSRSADAGEPRSVPLNPVIEGLEKMLRRVIGSRVAIRLHLHEEAGAVRMDPGQLEQVVLNLVVNARDAMPDGGTITISTAPCSGGAGGGERRTRLSVRDTGIGMDEETAQRVFEPFYTTKARGEGTGLGLSTVYGIVQQHEGRIRIDSVPGRGTTFHIEVPTREPEPEPVADPAAPESGGAGREATILLVEDEEAVRTIMARVLQRSGHTILQATTAEEAWVRMTDEASIDLLVTDVSLPGESGLELAARIRKHELDLPILFASGSDGLHPEVAAVAGTTDFLQKPFTPADLEEAVGRMLSRDSAVSRVA